MILRMISARSMFFFAESINDDELLTKILMQAQDKERSFGDELADKVASFGGSWAFIITFFSLLFC